MGGEQDCPTGPRTLGGQGPERVREAELGGPWCIAVLGRPSNSLQLWLSAHDDESISQLSSCSDHWM